MLMRISSVFMIYDLAIYDLTLINHKTLRSKLNWMTRLVRYKPTLNWMDLSKIASNSRRHHSHSQCHHHHQGDHRCQFCGHWSCNNSDSLRKPKWALCPRYLFHCDDRQHLHTKYNRLRVLLFEWRDFPHYHLVFANLYLVLMQLAKSLIVAKSLKFGEKQWDKIGKCFFIRFLAQIPKVPKKPALWVRVLRPNVAWDFF